MVEGDEGIGERAVLDPRPFLRSMLSVAMLAVRESRDVDQREIHLERSCSLLTTCSFPGTLQKRRHLQPIDQSRQSLRGWLSCSCECSSWHHLNGGPDCRTCTPANTPDCLLFRARAEFSGGNDNSQAFTKHTVYRGQLHLRFKQFEVR